MVLLMQKVRDLEIHLNNPKQKQGNGSNSPLLSLNIKKRLEEAQEKMKASLSFDQLQKMYLTSLIRTRGNHMPPKEILIGSSDLRLIPEYGEPQRTQHNERSLHHVSLQACIPLPQQPAGCWRGLSALGDAVPGSTLNFRTEKNTEQLTSPPISRQLPAPAQQTGEFQSFVASVGQM